MSRIPRPKSVERRCPVVLLDQGFAEIREMLIVPITVAQRDVLQVLIDAYPERVGMTDLVRRSHRGGANTILSRLALKKDWKDVIGMAETPIAPTASSAPSVYHKQKPTSFFSDS